MGVDVSFVLVHEAVVDATAVVDAAASMGIALVRKPSDEGEPLTFEVDGGASLFVMPVGARHPDADQMAHGPLSPSAEDIASHTGHLIVTALELGDDTETRDRRMSILTGAVVRGCSAIAAMLGHGVVFVRPDVFAGLAEAAAESGEVPVELAVDLTAARESQTHMSFLTHGMKRYGREEFYVKAPIEGQGALGFVLAMARWMISDPDKQLPSGDTVGRDADERVVVQRVDSPTGDGTVVVLLEL